MLKTIIGKLEKKKVKKIMTWIVMWYNWNVATINAMLQFLEILVAYLRVARDNFFRMVSLNILLIL